MLLPKKVMYDLIQASKIDSGVPNGDSVDRTKEIQTITNKARYEYPRFFVQDILKEGE